MCSIALSRFFICHASRDNCFVTPHSLVCGVFSPGNKLKKNTRRDEVPAVAWTMAAVSGSNSMIPADNVVMGVPKKGRLYDRCMKLLAGAGMDHRRVSVCFYY